MADSLATPEELADLPGMAGLPETTATALLELATAVVQSVTGQRLVEVTDDEVTILGTVSSWLALPQRPVTSVTAVTIDGQAVTDHKVFGSRLWRCEGWSRYIYSPAQVAVTYDHGYPAGDWRLGPARAAVLMLAAGGTGTPGATSESIDDYQIVFDKMAARLEASETLTANLRRTYGTRAGLVKIG